MPFVETSLEAEMEAKKRSLLEKGYPEDSLEVLLVSLLLLCSATSEELKTMKSTNPTIAAVVQEVRP